MSLVGLLALLPFLTPQRFVALPHLSLVDTFHEDHAALRQQRSHHRMMTARGNQQHLHWVDTPVPRLNRTQPGITDVDRKQVHTCEAVPARDAIDISRTFQFLENNNDCYGNN